MVAIWSVMVESFRLLRRDKIFLPAAVIGGVLMQLAISISELGIENITQMLFNFASAGFHLTGAVVAILWGSKIISDTRQEGSIEVQLASPVSRPAWLLGKFLGMTTVLLLLGCILIGIWQLLTAAQSWELLPIRQLVILSYMILGWIVIAALAIFFSSFTSGAVSLFCTACAWLLGMTSAAIYQSLPNKTHPLTVAIMKYSAYLWDLQRFNFASLAHAQEALPQEQLTHSALYGVLLIVLLLSFACTIFSKRDIVN